MFTGIVEEMGVVERTDRGLSTTFVIMAREVLKDLETGDSIAVNGVCLTVVAKGERTFSVEVSPETLRVTNLGSLKIGGAVNLERAMRLVDRVGGHLVSGHVDGTGIIRERRPEGNALVVAIEAPRDLLRYCVAKGSVAVDGVSLTINSVAEREFTVSIIPHTAKATTLGVKGVAETVNLEADLVAKYIERFSLPRADEESDPRRRL